MATQIGTIKTLIGTVTAKTAEGAQRTLQTTDIVYQDDVIITGEFGAVEIELTDGSLIDLGQNSEAVLDPNTLYPENNADANGDAIQQAILDGADPTQNAEPTAAGPEVSSGNEGTNIVQVQHLAPETTPSSGFDTTGINFAFVEEIEQIDDELQTVTPDNFVNGLPSVGENLSISLDDDALTDGNPGGIADDADSENTTGTLAHSFGLDGEGTLLLSDTGAPAGFVYSLNGDGTVLTISQDGTDVLQVTLADLSSGDYTITQLAPINHPESNDENNQGFNLAYQVTDGDGDTVNGQVNISVDDDSPVVTVKQDIVNDIAYSFTVTNHDEVSSAGYNSSYGYYIKDAGGNPTTGVVVWDNVKDADATSITLSDQFTPEQVGFFIIPNGNSNNPSLTDNTEITFELVDGEWTAFDAGQPLIGNGSPVLFDNAGLNKDNEDHVQDNALIGNQNWEDLPIINGDRDYNDVNVNVEWTAVTVTGDSLNTASFGADGPGSLDFTLGNVTILGDLTSNGKDVTFEARDTDNDGHNDQIIGSTVDGDVLSIEGILDSDSEVHIFAPVDSNNVGTGDVQITANLSITDGDGDNAFATLNFNLDINQITETATPVEPI